MAASTTDVSPDECLLSPPKDGISCLAFSREAGSGNLLVASWDGTVSMHSTTSRSKLDEFEHDGPVLSCCWQGVSTALTGSVDRHVRRIDFGSAAASSILVGAHDGAVRSVCWSDRHNVACSASWDGTLRVWDVRAPGKPTSVLKLPGKAFGMDICPGGVGGGAADAIVVGTDGRNLVTVDLRRPDVSLDDRVSSLKHQLRCVTAMPVPPPGAKAWGTAGVAGVVTGSIEGRVALEYLPASVTGAETDTLGFGFKCHRSELESGGAVAFPVNAIAFNSKYGTFATGGADGTVAVWDGQAKKRVGKAIGPFATSVSALSFSSDSDLLAIAVSYTFEAGDLAHPADTVVLKALDSSDIAPRAKKE
jgi:cell cycle arrest protein BUB3